MKITFKSRLGYQTVDTDTYCASFASTGSVLFQAIEHIWNEWFELNANNNKELADMYFSEEAIYTKKGAIRQGIEYMIEYCEENNITFFTTKDFWKADIETAFE